MRNPRLALQKWSMMKKLDILLKLPLDNSLNNRLTTMINRTMQFNSFST